MRIENLEIKRSAIEIVALGRNPLSSGKCDTCDKESDFMVMQINCGPVDFNAFVGTVCAEKYLRMLAE